MRDKNKLKKLLTLLAIGTIGLTPVVGVVACGTQKTDDSNNDSKVTTKKDIKDLITNTSLGSIPVESTIDNDSIINWVKTHLLVNHSSEEITLSMLEQIDLNSLQVDGNNGQVVATISDSNPVEINDIQYSGSITLEFNVNHEKTGSHPLDKLLTELNLGTFAYNATDQTILSRLLTLNNIEDSSVGLGLILNGNVVSGTITVDGKTYSGDVIVEYNKNNEPESRNDLASLFGDTDLGTIDYNKVDLSNLDEVSKWVINHLNSKNHFSDLVLENEISNVISEITFGTPSINEDGTEGTIVATVSDNNPIQLDGTKYFGKITLTFKTTHLKIKDISVIQDDLSNLLNDSTMATTEWTISGLLDKKLGGDSEYKDKTLSELGIDISQADHNDENNEDTKGVYDTKDYTFTVKESSDYFTKDTSTTITHNLDISVVADEIKSWLDAAAWGEKTSAGINAVTDPDNWFSWASSNTSTLQNKTMSDVWPHGLNSYGFKVSKSKDADNNDCLKITLDSDGYDLGFNTSSDDDENSYILWSFSLPSVDNISTIKDDLQSLVDAEDKNDEAWDLTELQNEKLGGNSDNKDKTLSELGITVTESDTLSGTNTSDETQKLIFTANGMSYSGSQEIDHNYTKTTFTKDDISVIQDDLSNLLNDSTMITTEWTISDLQGKKLGGDSEYKDKTLSELGIDISQADHNGSEKHKNNDENVSNVQDYTFTAKESSEYFTKDTSTTITHNLDISVVADEIKSWIDAAAYGEKTSAGIDAVTDPDNWFSWASSNTSKLQEKTMSDVWNHALQKYGFTVSKSKDADGNDCLKITFDSDDYDLGFNASSDDDENSYILWSYANKSISSLITNKDLGAIPVGSTTNNDSIISWVKTHIRKNHQIDSISDDDLAKITFGTPSINEDGTEGTIVATIAGSNALTIDGTKYSGSVTLSFAFNHEKTGFHPLDKLLTELDLGTFAYNATNQTILSRLLTLNNAGESSVDSGLSLNGNTVSGTITVDGKTYSGSVDITYDKNSESSHSTHLEKIIESGTDLGVANGIDSKTFIDLLNSKLKELNKNNKNFKEITESDVDVNIDYDNHEVTFTAKNDSPNNYKGTVTLGFTLSKEEQIKYALFNEMNKEFTDIKSNVTIDSFVVDADNNTATVSIERDGDIFAKTYTITYEISKNANDDEEWTISNINFNADNARINLSDYINSKVDDTDFLFGGKHITTATSINISNDEKENILTDFCNTFGLNKEDGWTISNSDYQQSEITISCPSNDEKYFGNYIFKFTYYEGSTTVGNFPSDDFDDEEIIKESIINGFYDKNSSFISSVNDISIKSIDMDSNSAILNIKNHAGDFSVGFGKMAPIDFNTLITDEQKTLTIDGDITTQSVLDALSNECLFDIDFTKADGLALFEELFNINSFNLDNETYKELLANAFNKSAEYTTLTITDTGFNLPYKGGATWDSNKEKFISPNGSQYDYNMEDFIDRDLKQIYASSWIGCIHNLSLAAFLTSDMFTLTNNGDGTYTMTISDEVTNFYGSITLNITTSE